MQSDPPIQTLLSSLETFKKHDVFPHHAVHPFSTAAPATCGLLQDLINTTEQLSQSLATYDASPQWTNPKLISQLRQHTAAEHDSQTFTKNIHLLVDVLSKRTGVVYGENIPLLETAIPKWCVDQVAAWGTSLGMETFKDESREGSFNVVLGGKSLVIDVDFVISRQNPLKPVLKVSNVKTANALLPPNSTTSNGTPSTTSTMLDAFLRDGIESYCAEMQKGESERSAQRAASLRRDMLDHLRYLVLLDGLASRKDDGGIRWVTDIDELWPVLKDLAKSEAQVTSSSMSSPKTPLDIFLLRAHALPLPYLTSPSISFLTYISPMGYLSLVRDAKQDQLSSNLDEPAIDISLSRLKSRLQTLTTGITIATLSLNEISEAHLYPPSMSMPNITARPTFPLVASAAELDHSLPQLDGYGMVDNNSAPFSWVLDFTGAGKRPGVVMSQSRMKSIELVVNPLGGGDGMGGVTDMLSFGTGSWIDILLNPGNAASPERYTSLYVGAIVTEFYVQDINVHFQRSPNSLHPPLQLRLTAPEEPGFILERIPVHSIKEIWGILEVVREQCWLNEILLGARWTPEGLKSEEEDVPADDTAVTTQELQAVLAGTFSPRKIPVNVFLPAKSSSDNLFDFEPESRPKIVMTSPERTPISGLVEITVTLDETKPRGISVDVQGAMGSDLKPSELEEICRRGGTLGLSGRVWATGHGLSL